MWEKLCNFTHLHAFIEVAQCGNISRAARHVHLSQPAITQAVAKLERELNVSLFERGLNGMLLTGPGDLFRRRVKCAIGHLQTGASETPRIGGKRRSGGFSHFERLMTAAQLRALAALPVDMPGSTRPFGVTVRLNHLRAASDISNIEPDFVSQKFLVC